MKLMRGFVAAVLAVSVFAGAASAGLPSTDPVAYWRFEEGTADQEFPFPPTDGGPGSGIAIDSAGGDDPMRTFAGFTNPVYRSNVPFGVVPRTGAANNLSLDFNPNEDLYSEGAPINNRQLNQFTIEASVRFDDLDGWQTFLGKDGFQVAGSPDPNLASLYFQLANDAENQDKVAFKVHQSAGGFIDLYTQQTVEAGRWYNFAAVLSNDGTAGDPDDQTLSLYLFDPGTGQYVLQESEDFRGGMALQDRNWTIGRGMYANNPADWIDGQIDEVRISAVALPTSQLLAVPEPSSLGLLGLAGLFALRRRRQG